MTIIAWLLAATICMSFTLIGFNTFLLIIISQWIARIAAAADKLDERGDSE